MLQDEKYIVETNTREAREVREVAQFFYVDSRMNLLVGQPSTLDSLNFIRTSIFGPLCNVRGDDPTASRKTVLVFSGRNLTDAESAKEFFPKFCSLNDELDNRMGESEDKDESAIRLASIIYSIGGIIHNYRDGNGQTYKMLAQRALHRNHSNSSDMYFVFKRGKRGKITGAIEKVVNEVNPFPFDDRVPNLIKTYTLIKNNPCHTSPWANTQNTIGWDGLIKLYDKWEKEARDVLIEEPIGITLSEALKIHANSLELQLSETYPDLRANNFENSFREKQFDYFLNWILSTTKGRQLVIDYVLLKDNPSHHDENIGRISLSIFEDIKEKILDNLESWESHVADFNSRYPESIT